MHSAPVSRSRVLKPLMIGAMLTIIGHIVCSADEWRLSSSWAPEPSLLEQLDAESAGSGFTIRPPRGYQLIKQTGPNGSHVFGWKGGQRPDGVSPYLMVSVAPIPPGEHSAEGLEQALDAFLGGVQRRRTSWARTPTERGHIGALEFVRATWSGVEPSRNIKMHGFSYVTATGEAIVQISSQDVDPGDETTLKLAEASALTFKGVDRNAAKSP